MPFQEVYHISFVLSCTSTSDVQLQVSSLFDFITTLFMSLIVSWSTALIFEMTHPFDYRNVLFVWFMIGLFRPLPNWSTEFETKSPGSDPTKIVSTVETE